MTKVTVRTEDSGDNRLCPLLDSLSLASDHEAHLHYQGALYNHEAHLHHPGALLHQDNQAPLLHYEAKAKASLRVSERTWESRRIKEEMQGIVSPTPLELHKVSPRSWFMTWSRTRINSVHCSQARTKLSAV